MNKIFKFKNIYIEISDRQTGKSPRMLEDIYNYIKEFNKPIGIITYNFSSFEYIKEKLERIYKDLDFKIINNLVKRITSMHNISNDVRVYIDEFYCIKDLDFKIYLRDNIYLCGTPDQNKSQIIKDIENFTSWKRKKIINKLLENEN